MSLNRRGHPEARAQVEKPQVKYICKKGLKIPPQVSFYRLQAEEKRRER
jgi:hypothetical protein